MKFRQIWSHWSCLSFVWKWVPKIYLRKQLYLYVLFNVPSPASLFVYFRSFQSILQNKNCRLSGIRTQIVQTMLGRRTTRWPRCTWASSKKPFQPFPATFFFIYVFSVHLTANSMTGFEPRSSGVSTNCVITNSPYSNKIRRKRSFSYLGETKQG